MIFSHPRTKRRLKRRTDCAPIKFQGELSPIDFVENRLGVLDLETKLRENSSAWLCELNTIMRILDPWAELIDSPNYDAPVALEGWTQITPDLAIYRGEHYRAHGIWRLEKDTSFFPNPRTDADGNIWNFFPMACEAKFRWFDESVPYDVKDFTNTRFKQGKNITHYKRDIRDFVSAGTSIIAKETERSLDYFQKRPITRLTDLRDYTTSRELPEEVKLGFYLFENGVPVPKTYGVYTELLQEYSFFEKVEGVNPKILMTENLPDFLHQDATLLAKLAKCGLGKPGFTDLDDKIFDGRTLFLVDWDECIRLMNDDDESFIYVSNPFDSKLRGEYQEVVLSMYDELLHLTVDKYASEYNMVERDLNTYKNTFWNEVRI